MQDATRRPLLAHTLTSQESRSFVRIDAIDARQSRSLSAKPIARLTAAFVAALQRIGPRELQSICDENAVRNFSNAIWMKMIPRSQGKIGSNSGGA
ncbi:hypothetical protein [Cupriavidus pinatubonensis]|uniref:hypothetical protein n=1 Tax=Cupriavidus pinatubonensis TaxID=248026 RepID=UPI00112DB08F|nr:hypothetical protein [Cupriavidus pinatubonensis]